MAKIDKYTFLCRADNNPFGEPFVHHVDHQNSLSALDAHDEADNYEVDQKCTVIGVYSGHLCLDDAKVRYNEENFDA